MGARRFFFFLSCLLGWLLLAATSGCGPGDPKGRAVILISVDTLRQDRLECYGYGRSTSPNLLRFAREDAVVFESAYAQAPYTLPSHMSMLTGLYPEAHGILTVQTRDGSGATSRLSSSIRTLAEVLKEQGFSTEAFTDGVLVDSKFGFGRGFDNYRDENLPNHEKNGFRKFGKELHQWIEDHRDEEFFLFIHTYDTHAPYVPPEPFRSRFSGEPPAKALPDVSMIFMGLMGYHEGYRLKQYAGLQDLVDRYDGGVAFVDDELGKLFRVLKEAGLWEEALIVVTSDHGETFVENGFYIGHGLGLNNEEMLVPLLVKFPGSVHAGRRISQIVESVDIMPTMLAALNIPSPRDVQGQNLLSGLERGRWAKEYAYGYSPNTGNRYFVRNNIKFIEAVEDPLSRFLKASAKPLNPPTSPRPAVPYYVWRQRDKKYYYDFARDPLGVKELFGRGDRAYDLSGSSFEWMAEEIHDPAVLLEYKRTAYAIAARSAKLGKKYWEESDASNSLSRDDLERLNALGYGGFIEEPGPEESDSSSITGGEADSVALRITPPLTDRSLLHRGDTFLWALHRHINQEGASLNPEEFESGREQARADFEAFLAQHSEKREWVEWRLKMLDLAPELYSGVK